MFRKKRQRDGYIKYTLDVPIVAQWFGGPFDGASLEIEELSNSNTIEIALPLDLDEYIKASNNFSPIRLPLVHVPEGDRYYILWNERLVGGSTES